MRVIALFGRGNVGKTHCLGHLINLMYQEMFGHGCLIEGQDKSVTFEYHGLRITICTWGDTSEDEQKNLDYISCQTPDIAIVATRTKGGTVELVRQYCERKGCSLKWVEKYVANPEDASEQEYMNHLQARQILEYIRDVIEGHLYYVDCISAIDVEGKRYHVALFGTEMTDEGFPRSFSIELNENQMHYLCQRDRSVASAYQTALKKKDDIAIALALSPFARKTAELVKSGAYEAAGSCYVIFRCLAKTCKEHEDWYAGFTGYGDSYTKLAIFTEAVVELYCHLRQKSDLSKRMADEMDINLEVFNLETDFFGDLHCSSRFTDMLCDAQAQYGDYSELDECPMWEMWEKEEGE